MCIPCVDTRNDPLGIRKIFNEAITMVAVGGITAIVAAFAAAYFDSGMLASTALSTTAVIGTAIALTGATFFVLLMCAIDRALMSR